MFVQVVFKNIRKLNNFQHILVTLKTQISCVYIPPINHIFTYQLSLEHSHM